MTAGTVLPQQMPRHAAAVLALIGSLVVSGALPATADDPYAADPNGLVPFIDTVQQVYTRGTDTWEVWVCDVPDWNVAVDLDTTVSRLNANITPYFQWLSDGAYRPSFVAGGRVTSNDKVSADPSQPEKPFAPGCEAEVAQASSASPNGVLIVVDAGVDRGYATAGAVCPEPPFSGCSTTYPDNARRAVVGAAAVVTVSPLATPQWITVAHEIGHALAWAHSFGGLTKDPATLATSEYDNPMDVMSGEIHNGMPPGTVAYNRYAAGWIDPSDVVVHTSGSARYDLAAVGSAEGLGMVAIPGDGPAHFYVLGARRRASYDSKLPKAGVEVYEVDQRREVACNPPEAWPTTWPCFATLLDIHQFPAVEGFDGTDHVLGIDEQLTVGGFVVKVVAANTSGFTVQISEKGSGTFVDDDGSLYEPDIEAIASLGITRGCNPPTNDRYCPERTVTRAEMAAFLVRALGREGELGAYRGWFPDVPEGAWYTPYVELLADLGVTTGYTDGTYRPDATVSRAEMAVFLVRAFFPDSSTPAVGVFTDVPKSAWYADQVEELYRRNVTNGCGVDRYCPLNPVRRDQMASFLARTLGS